MYRKETKLAKVVNILNDKLTLQKTLNVYLDQNIILLKC